MYCCHIFTGSALHQEGTFPDYDVLRSKGSRHRGSGGVLSPGEFCINILIIAVISSTVVSNSNLTVSSSS